MADNAAEKVEPAPAPVDQGKKNKPPMLLMGFLLLNTIALLGVGALLYMNNQKEMAKATMEPIAKGAMEDDASMVDDGG
ncbi:MAG: hypothetical protein HRT44_07085, partial [Bdellovibrionales bacterium]|nr:hypothetical protein [Bdellovibrionales bacterium]NQZ19001.1 hypothetical protein [Bdellovibrionales bacterium]